MNYDYIRAILNCQTTPAGVAVYTFGAKTNNGPETSAATLLAGIHRPTEQARVQLPFKRQPNSFRFFLGLWTTCGPPTEVVTNPKNAVILKMPRRAAKATLSYPTTLQQTAGNAIEDSSSRRVPSKKTIVQ